MAKITVDLERGIGTLDRRVFGGFIEHLGRCIYGGIFDEGSGLSDEHGYRQDVLDALRPLRMPVLRWPGRESGLPRNYLTLEITESVLMDDVEATLKTLVRLKELGVKLAVDDFGTGYSSLAYLRRFPVDFLKIDRSFVNGLGLGADDSGAIVETMISLPRALGLRVVAEGIETREQLDYLKYLDCDLGQGFFLSRPLRAADAAGILASAHAKA